MKTLFILAVALIPSLLSAQPVFRSVEWGMSPDAVASVEGRDANQPFADTAFGKPAVISYVFVDGALAGVDLDFTRPHDSTLAVVAAQSVVDGYQIRIAVDRRFGYTGNWEHVNRAGGECADTTGPWAPRLAAGCFALRVWWGDASTRAEQVLDGASGRILHTMALRRWSPSGIADESRATALDLR